MLARRVCPGFPSLELPAEVLGLMPTWSAVLYPRVRELRRAVLEGDPGRLLGVARHRDLPDSGEG